MAENTENKNKYVSPSRLSLFLENLKNIFSPLVHKHTISEISDYAIDDALSATSSNPVQNKVLDTEFQAISDALTVYDAALDDKADIKHTHTTSDISDLTVSADELNFVSGVTSNVQNQLDTLTNRIFIGTYEQYQTAYANNQIPINTIVILTDDASSGGGSSGDDATSSTTAMLGYAVLGQMVLG